MLLTSAPVLDMASESIITLAPTCFLSNSIMRPPPETADWAGGWTTANRFVASIPDVAVAARL